MAPVSVRHFAALTALLGASALGETLTIDLQAGRAAEIVLDSPVDDRNFQDPRGYLHHGPRSRPFIRRLTLTNTGTTPLTGPLLVVNGADWTRTEALPASFPPPPRGLMPRLFDFWRECISHADSDAPGIKEPLALLNFWGYALCGDTTAGLTHLAAEYGVPARKIPLNGHIAAEYFYDDGWHILDADQNLCYPRLDNRTLASAADLRADPFISRRTKVFGRYAAMHVATAAFNTSLHEFIEPKEEKAVRPKAPPAPVRSTTLLPGEKMIVHFDQAPEEAIGRTDLRRWGTLREDALRIVEFGLDPKARAATAAGTISFASGYPILRAVNHTTGESFGGSLQDPSFEITAKFRSPADRLSVFCQRSEVSLPRLQKGRNTVLLAPAAGTGTARLDVEWDRAPADLVVPEVKVALDDASLTFHLRYSPDVDLVWWQVSSSAEFDFVPPNFDSVTAATASLDFDPLTASFFNPGQPYYFRAKVRHAGVWGEWSAALPFQASKPTRPAPVRATIAGDRWQLSWPDAGAGCEYLVFGSNRLDFLPEPYAAEEIVVMRNQGIEQSRPNKNLVATVTQPQIELEPAYRFYRVVARRAGALSVPGDLLVTPPALAAKLPPALVLQDRWQRVEGRDQHLATELPLR